MESKESKRLKQDPCQDPCHPKRVIHFKEYIRHIIFQEQQGPPDNDLIPNIIKFFEDNDKFYHFINNSQNRFSNITEPDVHFALRKLNRKNCYEYTRFIVRKLRNEKPLEISPELESRIISMFEKISCHYKKHTSPGRSFFSYSYTIYKILELFGEYVLSRYFLKPAYFSDDIKHKTNNNIFRNIIQEIQNDNDKDKEKDIIIFTNNLLS
jgi:hypothetical protein